MQRPHVVLIAACALTLLYGCKRQQQQQEQSRALQQPSVSVPIAAGKVWHDTIAHKTINGIGQFTVTVIEGQVHIEPPEGLTKLRWSVRTVAEEAMPAAVRQRPTATAAVAGDMDGDGVLDCEDWCMEVPGTPEYRGCPPGVEGIPPVRWVELLRMTEGGNELIIEFGLEDCTAG